MDTAYYCWNWKYYSKIIFKYVNSAVGPIFNEKVVKKYNLWDPWTVQCINTLFTVDLSTIVGWKKNKKREKNTNYKMQMPN